MGDDSAETSTDAMGGLAAPVIFPKHPKILSDEGRHPSTISAKLMVDYKFHLMESRVVECRKGSLPIWSRLPQPFCNAPVTHLCGIKNYHKE